MRFDLLVREAAAVVDAPRDGVLPSPAEVHEAVRRLPPDATFRLGAVEALDGPRAAALFRALLGTGRRFHARLTTAAVCHKAALDEAARAGCVAIEVEREGPLLPGLASGHSPEREETRALVVALRRARGLGVATIARLRLGLPGDDEGVFERTLRFARRALLSLPIVEPAEAASDEAASGAPAARMDDATLENGIRWLRARLVRHAAIWRRSLWPTGSTAVTLRAGYDLRRLARDARPGRYTPTMHLLRRLNRTKRARSAAEMLSAQTAAIGRAGESARAGWLRTLAWSDSHLGALFIRVEGTLDVRGARALLRRVGQASTAGFRRVTIDFGGLEWIARDVVTHFLEENRARFRELAQHTRIENLASIVESLRRQLGDCEALRLLEQAR